jgi:hypothetical protein
VRRPETSPTRNAQRSSIVSPDLKMRYRACMKDFAGFVQKGSVSQNQGRGPLVQLLSIQMLLEDLKEKFGRNFQFTRPAKPGARSLVSAVSAQRAEDGAMRRKRQAKRKPALGCLKPQRSAGRNPRKTPGGDPLPLPSVSKSLPARNAG